MASCLGVAMAPLFYRQLKKEKTAALKFHHGNFDESMALSPKAESDLQWWVENIENVSKPISQGNPSTLLIQMHPYMDRQLFFGGQSSGGHWAPDEAHQHINCLELKAAYLGLQSSYKNLSHTHLRTFLDNTSAVSYINNMGGTHSLECNQIARTIWCGALYGLFDYLLHICQESVILQLIKPPEFFMVRQNGSFIPTFMCQSHKHLLIYLHPGLIFRPSLTKLGTLTLVPYMLFFVD